MKKYKLISCVKAFEIGSELTGERNGIQVQFPGGESCLFYHENFLDVFRPIDERFSELDDFPETETVIQKAVSCSGLPSNQYRVFDSDGLSVFGLVGHDQESFQDIRMLGFDESGEMRTGAHSEQLIMILLDRLKYAFSIPDEKKTIIEHHLRCAMKTIIETRLDIISNQSNE